MALNIPSTTEDRIPPPSSIPCQECQTNPAVYACPRCRRRTCSLACCRAHKERTQCSGKRDLTAFLPLSQMTDSTLQSDYHFLENILGTIESGRKHIPSQPKNASKHVTSSPGHSKRQRTDASPEVSSAWLLPGVPPSGPQKHFVAQAAQRRVTVRVQPPMMQRHQRNQSYANKHGHLFWTVEWRFHDCPEANAKNQSIYYSTVKDDTPIQQALQDCLAKHNLILSDDLSSYRLLLKRIPCPANRPLYSELVPSNSLALCLQDRTVIEFPTVEVVSTHSRKDFPLLVQERELTEEPVD